MAQAPSSEILKFVRPFFLAFLVAAALAGSLVGPSAAAMSAPGDAPAQAGGFQLIGTHPQASQQPTDRGKTLNFLRYWNGAIYAGYGDYDANTGPIAITPFALSTDQFAAQPALWADSEELQVFRSLNGNLYAPSIDPRTADDYSETPLAGPWRGRNVVDALHIYDMATRTGGELWMVGSAGDNAVAWRSLDEGVTWSIALAVPPRQSADFARFYFAGVHQNTLYVQAVDNGGGKHPASEVFDGSDWSDGPDLLPQGGYGYDTEQFDGGLLYLSRQSSPSSLLSFDGAEVTNSGQVFYNYSADGGKLYGLGENGQIRKTNDLTSWVELEPAAPPSARSIVVIDGVIYVGTTDSRLYRLSRPSSPSSVSGAAPASCKGKHATLAGTDGPDKLRGTPTADVIAALPGNDKLSGLAGNDVICGGSGKDTLKGGKGQDTLLGHVGKDKFNGGGGKDFCKGGKGRDTAFECEVEKSI
jgi:Ca2+-binding RTX toxin-like protein